MGVYLEGVNRSILSAKQASNNSTNSFLTSSALLVRFVALPLLAYYLLYCPVILTLQNTIVRIKYTEQNQSTPSNLCTSVLIESIDSQTLV
jgi:hypothetical protein